MCECANSVQNQQKKHQKDDNVVLVYLNLVNL